MRGLHHFGQQGAPLVRAGVPVAGPGAVLPLSPPKWGRPGAPAERLSVRPLLGYSLSFATYWLLLGQATSWIRKEGAARVQEGRLTSKRTDECLKITTGVTQVFFKGQKVAS